MTPAGTGLWARLAPLAGQPGLWLAATEAEVVRRLYMAGAVSPATPAIRIWSLAGEHAAIWHALALAGALRGPPWRRRRWRRGAVAVFGAQGVNLALKHLFGRRRPAPAAQLASPPTQLGFPSAHTTSSFAAAQAFAGLLPPGPRWAMAISLPATRLWLAVHYPTDILAGAVVGTLVGRWLR